MSNIFRSFLLVLYVAALAACGGGGGGSDEPESTVSLGADSGAVNVEAPDNSAAEEETPDGSEESSEEQKSEVEPEPATLAVKGMAVKGPLINAVVRAYRVDPSKANLQGELLAEGLTDNNAALLLNIAVEDLGSGLILIEYIGGRELDGSQPVITSLRTIASADQIINQTPIFATPLTTLAIDYVRAGALSSSSNVVAIEQALAVAESSIKEAFGFGVMGAELDLFTSSPVLDTQTDQRQSWEYRAAIEAFAAIVELLREESIVQGAPVAAESIVDAVAVDMLDGVLDGKNDGAVLASLAAIESEMLEAIISIPPEELTVPGTTLPVADVASAMSAELARISPSVVPDLEIGVDVLTAVVPHFQGGEVEPEPVEPMPEPVAGADPEPVAGTGPEPVAETDPEPGSGSVLPVEPKALYSYSNDISTALPLQGATLEQRTVYIFWQGDEVSQVHYYCCKGMAGDSVGESHNPKVTVSNPPFAMALDMSQFVTEGARELYVDFITDEGQLNYDNFTRFDVSIKLASVPSPEPEPTPEPEEASPEPEPTPEPETVPEPFSKTITLSWQAPSSRENGDPLAVNELDGYEIIYYREGSDAEAGQVKDVDAMDASGALITSIELVIAETGTWYFSIASSDKGGLSSSLSEPVSAVIE